MAGSAGEERVEPPQVEQSVLAGGTVLLGVEVGDPPHDQPARDLVCLLWAANAVKSISAWPGSEPVTKPRRDVSNVVARMRHKMCGSGRSTELAETRDVG